jgi:hypothetical protein
MSRTLMRRDANPGSLVGDTDATYLRLVGRRGRVRYRRIGIGRRTKRIGAKAQQTVTRLAYAVCTLSPDAADEILALPSRQVGRMVKAALRRARKTAHRRGFFRRRPSSCVLRIQAPGGSRGQSLAVG